MSDGWMDGWMDKWISEDVNAQCSSGGTWEKAQDYILLNYNNLYLKASLYLFMFF